MSVVAATPRHVPIARTQSPVALIETEICVRLRPLNFKWLFVVFGLFDFDHVIIVAWPFTWDQWWRRWRCIVVLDVKRVFGLVIELLRFAFE